MNLKRLSSIVHGLLKDALSVLDNRGFDFTAFDVNGDKVIDSVTFLHSGYGAEFGGKDAYNTDFTSRIWSHAWSMGSDYASNDGITVRKYTINPAVWATSASSIARIGVIAHETGHFLGISDLYDTDSGSGAGRGIGSWGLMADAWGFNGGQNYPPHMCSWTKIRLGWLTPVDVQYGLNIISATAIQNPNHPQVIRVTNGYFPNEYLLIENRQRIGFDGALPQGGLAIFHIDDNALYYTQGDPSQSNWPKNGNHYRIALLQADGQYHLEKNMNRGDSTDLFHGGPRGVNALLPTGVTGYTYPNTDTYQGGQVVTTTNRLTDISVSGMDMTFMFTSDAPTPRPTARPSPRPTKKPTSRPTKKPTPRPTKKPTPRPTKKPTPRPTKKPTPRPTKKPTPRPTKKPTLRPTLKPSPGPMPTTTPSARVKPTLQPTSNPSARQVVGPTNRPTPKPTPRRLPLPPTFAPQAAPQCRSSRAICTANEQCCSTMCKSNFWTSTRYCK
jgi:M6 family metalloprotease-like protein